MTLKFKSKSGEIRTCHNIKDGVSDEMLLRFFRDLNSLGCSIAGFWNKHGFFVEVAAD